MPHSTPSLAVDPVTSEDPVDVTTRVFPGVALPSSQKHALAGVELIGEDPVDIQHLQDQLKASFAALPPQPAPSAPPLSTARATLVPPPPGAALPTLDIPTWPTEPVYIGTSVCTYPSLIPPGEFRSVKQGTGAAPPSAPNSEPAAHHKL